VLLNAYCRLPVAGMWRYMAEPLGRHRRHGVPAPVHPGYLLEHDGRLDRRQDGVLAGGTELALVDSPAQQPEEPGPRLTFLEQHGAGRHLADLAEADSRSQIRLGEASEVLNVREVRNQVVQANARTSALGPRAYPAWDRVYAAWCSSGRSSSWGCEAYTHLPAQG